MIPEPMHSAYRLHRYSQQMGIAVILTGLLLGAGVVGFLLGIWVAEPVCIEAEVVG